MRGLSCRILRFNGMVKVAMALGMLVPFVAAVSAQNATTTTLSAAAANNPNACTQTISVVLKSASGTPNGVVAINDTFNSQTAQLATEALDSTGQVTVSFALATGAHALTAAYTGNANYQASTSSPIVVSVNAICNLTVASSLSVASVIAGQPANGSVTLTPLNNGGSTSPTFVTVSCSALPVQSSCFFTPENLEIPAGSNAPVTSLFTLQTEAKSGLLGRPSLGREGASPLALALLLPGILGLGWLGGRRNLKSVAARLARLSLLALIGVVLCFGASGCAARYSYLHHGPPNTPATPAGTYTFTVTAQTSNGVTAIEENSHLTLTVN